MALAEIEFELPAQQFEWMGYPALHQGEPLSVVLDAGVLLPDWNAESWYAVQAEPLTPALVNIGPALYAFAGQIAEADLSGGVGAGENGEAGAQSAILTVNCGNAFLRVTCAPREDGMLPWGTWETRYLTGVGRLQGIVEDHYETGVGRQMGVTIWRFRRLVLRPGDSLFGRWHETVDLTPAPFQYDRVIVTARVHRDRYG